MFVKPWRGGSLNFTDFLWEICIPGSCLYNQVEAQNLLSLRCIDFKTAETDNKITFRTGSDTAHGAKRKLQEK